jgi:hypothetical protein
VEAARAHDEPDEVANPAAPEDGAVVDGHDAAERTVADEPGTESVPPARAAEAGGDARAESHPRAGDDPLFAVGAQDGAG